MTLESLNTSVLELTQPTQRAADEFSEVREQLVHDINSRMLGRDDLEKMIGIGNTEMMKTNSANMALFMESIFVAFSRKTLTETIIWVFSAYRKHGFQTLYWATYLPSFVEILRDRISAQSLEEILPFFDWIIVNIPTFERLSEAIED